MTVERLSNARLKLLHPTPSIPLRQSVYLRSMRRWRMEAETKMRAKGKGGMTDVEVVDFVNRYMPAYKVGHYTNAERHSTLIFGILSWRVRHAIMLKKCGNGRRDSLATVQA